MQRIRVDGEGKAPPPLVAEKEQSLLSEENKRMLRVILGPLGIELDALLQQACLVPKGRPAVEQ